MLSEATHWFQIAPNFMLFPGLATDARNKTNLNASAGYFQDQIEFTRWLQFIGGVPHGPAALVELPIQFLSIKSITPST